jgi:photosystem II stability/assembly factor-like uncharacterized protein
MYIHILAFLLFFQSFVACRQVQENASPLEANLAFQSNGDSRQEPEKAPLPATGIIFRSIDDGQTWQDISAGLPGDKSADCFFAQNGELFLGSADGLYRSPITSAAPVWEKDFLLNEQTTGIFPGQAGPYSLSPENGFFQNILKGIWASVFSNLKEQMLRSIFETVDGTVFVGCDNGIFKSGDHGKTWKHVYKEGWMIQMVESGGVLICTSEQGILRSTDSGEHWDLVVTEGGVGIDVEVIEGGFAAITFNTESETRRVRISTDGGNTWQAIDAGLPPHASISSIKQVGNYFFCGHPDGIYRSDDWGKTWKLLLPSIKEKVFNLSVSGNVIYAIPRSGGC